MRNSVDFVKAHSTKICATLTREHQKIISQYENHKVRTKEELLASHNEQVSALRKLTIAEKALATENPISEAEYGLSKESALTLYDSLLPRLFGHRRVTNNQNSAKELSEKLQYQTALNSHDEMMKECQDLRCQVTYLESKNQSLKD